MAWGCDADPFAREVFAKRFGVSVMPDVREIDEGVERVEFLGGGFPCQDLSGAGKGAGLDGERSSLYFEMHRVIALMRPKLVLMENVPRLLRLHFGRLLRSLRDIGYNAEWDVISAAAVGAPHLRERLWIVAYEDEREVFGHPVGMFPTAHLDGDDDRAWPRAGRMRGSDVWELEPLAPSAAVRAGRVLLPTPVARDDGKTPEARVAMEERRPGATRRTLSSLAVLARNGFVQPDGRLMVPTPVARDWKGEGMEGQLGTVAARGSWPTPTAADGRGGPGGGAAMEGGPSLRTAVRGLWPTPQAADGTGGRIDSEPQAVRASGARKAITLATAVNHPSLWPTPLASMAAAGQGAGELHRRVNHDPPLWATPTAHPRTHDPRQVDHGAQIANQAGGPLNPTWIEWLMGFPLHWTDRSVENDGLIAQGWDEEPLPRTLRDVPHRRERLTALGNAIVWPVAYVVLERLLAAP